MPTIVEGDLNGKGKKFAIVVSRFNSFITDKLLAGAIEGLAQQGVEDKHITVAWTPGAFEIPLVAWKMAVSGKYAAIITLGCVIRGATPHFDFVAGEAARGVSRASDVTGIPVIFGVLTTNTVEQAVERAGTKSDNKGFESAMAAIEMANLMGNL